MTKLYVEEENLIDELGYFWNKLGLEEECNKAGLHFWQDDMGDCYISRNEDCEVYMELECNI